MVLGQVIIHFELLFSESCYIEFEVFSFLMQICSCSRSIGLTVSFLFPSEMVACQDQWSMFMWVSQNSLCYSVDLLSILKVIPHCFELLGFHSKY